MCLSTTIGDSWIHNRGRPIDEDEDVNFLLQEGKYFQCGEVRARLPVLHFYDVVPQKNVKIRRPAYYSRSFSTGATVGVGYGSSSMFHDSTDSPLLFVGRTA